jgi:hypothetical protein
MFAGRIGVHPPIRTSTDDQVLREAVADILESSRTVRCPSASRELETTRSRSTITSRVCIGVYENAAALHANSFHHFPVTVSHLIPVAMGYELVPAYIAADPAGQTRLGATADTFAAIALVTNAAGTRALRP